MTSQCQFSSLTPPVTHQTTLDLRYFRYKIGAALLDLNDPRKVIARSPKPLLEPKKRYERKGDIANVVFPEGAVVKGDELFVYYGAADKRCSLATCKLDELIDFLLKYKE